MRSGPRLNEVQSESMNANRASELGLKHGARFSSVMPANEALTRSRAWRKNRNGKTLRPLRVSLHDVIAGGCLMHWIRDIQILVHLDGVLCGGGR